MPDIKSAESVSSNGCTKGVGRTGLAGMEGAVVMVVVGVPLVPELSPELAVVVGVGVVDGFPDTPGMSVPSEKMGRSAESVDCCLLGIASFPLLCHSVRSVLSAIKPAPFAASMGGTALDRELESEKPPSRFAPVMIRMITVVGTRTDKASFRACTRSVPVKEALRESFRRLMLPPSVSSEPAWYGLGSIS